MSFFKWGRKKEANPDENEPVLAAVIKQIRAADSYPDLFFMKGRISYDNMSRM